MMLTPEQLAALRLAMNSGAIKDTCIFDLLAHIDAQQSRIAELEQDAARYRWLRVYSEVDYSPFRNGWVAGKYVSGRLMQYRQFELDSAIDAAMQNEKTT